MLGYYSWAQGGWVGTSGMPKSGAPHVSNRLNYHLSRAKTGLHLIHVQRQGSDRLPVKGACCSKCRVASLRQIAVGDLLRLQLQSAGGIGPTNDSAPIQPKARNKTDRTTRVSVKCQLPTIRRGLRTHKSSTCSLRVWAISRPIGDSGVPPGWQSRGGPVFCQNGAFVCASCSLLVSGAQKANTKQKNKKTAGNLASSRFRAFFEFLFSYPAL